MPLNRFFFPLPAPPIHKKGAFALAKAPWRRDSVVVKKVLTNQCLHQLVPVDLADHAAGTPVVGDVGGVFCQQLSNNLVDGVVSLLGQGVKHTAQDHPHILLVVGYIEGQSILIRHGHQLLFKRIRVLYPKNPAV